MIVERICEAKEKKIKLWPVKSNRASELGHPCLRYLVLLRTRWQERVAITKELQMVFDLGHVMEAAMEDDLREARFTVLEQQRPYTWDKYNITGRTDLKLAFDEPAILSASDHDACPPEIREMLLVQARSDNGLAIVPGEIKSSAPYSFESINSVADMFSHKYLYMRKYPAQLTLYLIMDGKEVGVFLFKEKVKGQPKEIWMRLDYEYAESLIQKAETINRHVADGTLPEPMDFDENICPECPFAHICMPERIGKEVEVLDDDHLLELLAKYDELKPGAKEFDQVDGELKKLLNGRDKLLIGNWFITGKWIDKTSYDMPAEIKEKYKVISQYWKRQIAKVEEH